MNHSDDYLQGQVVLPMMSALGRKLEAVRYGLLRNEVKSGVEVKGSTVALSGEVKLIFTPLCALYFSWYMSGAWPPRACLIGVSQTSFHKKPLFELTESHSELWDPYVGSPLVEFQVLGLESVPTAVRLIFRHGSVLIGSGGPGYFGEGDFVVIAPDREDSFRGYKEQPQMLWDSARTITDLPDDFDVRLKDKLSRK
jgi:hypothetical protein